MEGFKRGIPPTLAIQIKKNMMDIKIKQKPKEYMSLVLKLTKGFFAVLLSKNLGTTMAPMKNATKAIEIEITKLKVNLFKDKSKKIAKTTNTISGEKI